MSESIASDADRMKRVIEFIANKRSKDDLVILFDGRDRPCRKVMEAAEDKLAASGARAMVELFIVSTHPANNEHPRAWAADQFRAQHSRSSTVFIAIEKWISQARAAVRVQLLRGKCHISNYVHGRCNAPLE